MKNKSKELNVDIIGSQNAPMTKEEQAAISTFIKKMKEQRSKTRKRKLQKLEKQTA